MIVHLYTCDKGHTQYFSDLVIRYLKYPTVLNRCTFGLCRERTVYGGEKTLPDEEVERDQS